jgi:hypothetical protein
VCVRNLAERRAVMGVPGVVPAATASRLGGAGRVTIDGQSAGSGCDLLAPCCRCRRCRPSATYGSSAASVLVRYSRRDDPGAGAILRSGGGVRQFVELCFLWNIMGMRHPLTSAEQQLGEQMDRYWAPGAHPVLDLHPAGNIVLTSIVDEHPPLRREVSRMDTTG